MNEQVAATAPAPLPPALLIKSFTLCDFRAFAGPEPVTIDLDGKNLLVYGENGSGKSSIFHALNEFFAVPARGASGRSRQERFKELRNKFSGLPDADGHVEVQFVGQPAPIRWDHSRHPLDIAPTANPAVVNGAFHKAILDYRSLLETNYRHGSGSINLFEVCMNVLLRDYPVSYEGREYRLTELWGKLLDQLEEARGRKKRRAIQVINELAPVFNEGLRTALDLLKPKINELLTDLGRDDIRLVSLDTPGITYNHAHYRNQRGFSGLEIKPVIDFYSHSLLAPQTFLNEARLSALALAIYLAGRLVWAPTTLAETPRLMVLDDVLIGLDQSNRLPILQILEKHFADWQIVLLTHDRVWFEMARFFVADSKNWKALEMFERPDPLGRARPVLRPENTDAVAGNLEIAKRLHAANDYAAAAVHARMAFELSLKKLSERVKIPVRFHTDQRHLSTDDLLSAIQTWLKQPSKAIHHAKLAPEIVKLRMWRKVVLNPFSHSTPINLSAGEVTGAIDAVEALHKAFQTV